MGAAKFVPTGIRFPDHAANSESLYQLRYPGTQRRTNSQRIYNFFCEIRTFLNVLTLLAELTRHTVSVQKRVMAQNVFSCLFLLRSCDRAS
jgi:hypothetical protein